MNGPRESCGPYPTLVLPEGQRASKSRAEGLESVYRLPIIFSLSPPFAQTDAVQSPADVNSDLVYATPTRFLAGSTACVRFTLEMGLTLSLG